jgi:MerR family transcriptional regulator, light-induced transcriptional regulator
MSVDGSAESGAALRLRIGELSRRTGVGADTLRAWERRYGLLSPDRSAGGYRLYTDADAARVRAMQALIGEGLSASEAAEQVRTQSSQAAARPPSILDAEQLAPRLRDALERIDEASANAVLDEALAGLSLEFVVETVIFPALRDIGNDREGGRLSIGQEHFATNLLRGRLLGLARGWSTGSGPWAVLACPPGERHDLGLICFGLTLWRRGWRIAFLGADSPIATVGETAGRLGAELVVVAATDPSRVEEVADELRALGGEHQLAFGGAGVDPGLAGELGALSLPASPAHAAESLDPVVRGR